MFFVYVILHDLVAPRIVLTLEFKLVQLPHDMLVRLMKRFWSAPPRALLNFQAIYTFLTIKHCTRDSGTLNGLDNDTTTDSTFKNFLETSLVPTITRLKKVRVKVLQRLLRFNKLSHFILINFYKTQWIYYLTNNSHFTLL